MGRSSIKYGLLKARILPFVLFLIIINLANPVIAGSDFISFYSKAYSTTQSPPKLSSLSVLCAKKESWGRHATFAGNQDGEVFLVIFTKKQVKDLTRVITLKPLFLQLRENSPPVPTAFVTRDATLDWAYIYDRNGDGRVDYIAFLFGVLPFKPDNFPSDYPAGGQITDFEQIKLIFKHSRLQFIHYADDNFDGVTDAVIGVVLDPVRYPWVDQYGVLRSQQYDGNIDETWTFKNDIAQHTGIVAQENHKYILQNAPDSYLQTGKEWFDFGTNTMKKTNEYAQKCGLTEKSFLHE
jgi:hypothetical protein